MIIINKILFVNFPVGKNEEVDIGATNLVSIHVIGVDRELSYMYPTCKITEWSGPRTSFEPE